MLAYAPPPAIRGRQALATKFQCDAIGDSHTFNGSTGLTTPQFHPFLTQTALQALGCSEVIVNDGVSGNTTGQVLVRARLLPAVTTGSLAIIYCGTNDWNITATVQSSPTPTTTVFAVNAGLGASFQPNTNILVNGVLRTISFVSTDTITVSPALASAPTAGQSVQIGTAQNIIDTATQMAALGYTRQIIGRQHYLNFASSGDTLAAQQSQASQIRAAQDVAIAGIAGCVVADFYSYMRNLIVGGVYAQGNDLAWHVGVGNSHLNATGQQLLSNCIMGAISDAWLGAFRLPYDVDAQSWFSAVVANGGTVSDTQKVRVDALVSALKAAGSWSLMDDAWLLVAENSTQALTSLKQRRLATAVNSPTFTAGAGYAFDGSTTYINTAFVPLVNAVAMTGTSLRIGVYERTNLGSTKYHGIWQNSTLNLLILPRNGSNQTLVDLNSADTFISAGVTDSRGYTTGHRNGASFEMFKNGASLGTYAPGSTGSSLPSHAAFIGGYNNGSDVLTSPRNVTVGFFSVGASLSAAQELAEYNAIQAYMTAWGANV